MKTKILTLLFLAFASFAFAQEEPVSYEWLEKQSKIISDLQYKANGQEIDFGDNKVVTANYIKDNFSVSFSDKLASVSVNFSANGNEGLIVVENIDLTRVQYLADDNDGVLIWFPVPELEWQLYMGGEPKVLKDKFFYFKAANEADKKKMFTTFWQIINRLKIDKGLITKNEAEKQWKDWENLAIEDFYIKYPKSILAHEFNDEALEKVGSKYYFEEKYSEALPWLQRAANLKNGYANYLLGFMYNKGYGVNKDEAKALEYILKGAEQGDINAMIRAGQSYQYGWGVANDANKARAYYQKAVDNGSTEAILQMSDLYYFRTTNNKEVMLWSQKYIDKGGKMDEEHMERYESARSKYYGENPNELIIWSQNHLAKRGELTDKQMEELGMAYYAEKKYQDALEWLKKACDKGRKSYKIGTTIREIYSKGLGGIEKDRKAGRQWEDKCY